LQYHAPVWILVFAVLCAGLLGALGLVAGLWSEKFDQMAAFQSFVIMPMTFLSGVFYSIHSLPSFWQGLSHLNPFFYMIDGFRYGFFWPKRCLALDQLGSRFCGHVGHQYFGHSIAEIRLQNQRLMPFP
jgi:ABC-type polysaccharide/polyol phosphate export permease